MKVDPVTHRPWLEPGRLYVVFKYAVYLLLTVNLYFFFREEYLAIPALFPEGLNRGNFLEAYSATLDTLAWVVLLWLFELETAVISDERLRGGLKGLLLAIKAVCYVFIVTAFFGYLGAWLQVTDLAPFLADPCGLVATGGSWMETLDEYPVLDAASCAVLQGESLVRMNGTAIIGTVSASEAVGRLAMVDVINSGAWLLVVFALEVEVWLQLWDRLGPRLVRMMTTSKAVLYAVLFAAAVYWGFEGDFLDFWDAFLWLVAFVFIELNIFQWQAEVAEERAHGHGVRAPDDGRDTTS
ncbi:MAG: hypothetical protein V2I57_15845 [Xanthomonadales bacterium]|nr:hypothetical protein [Xanthomonadales bacterium]